MRNLKRALSLLLSSTMVLGMVVMGGSAAGYQDVDASYNQEAIEVLQAVGIMTGVDDAGNFNPDATVTRNEMAVIMSNLMAYNVATYSGTSPFTDVPDWAEPYVAACYTNGITAGISATEYGGDQTVTTAQAALMLMKALGYFQYQSDFGSDWQLSTISQGNKIDLFNGVDSGVKEAMTRNDVAQLVLNTLKSGMVEAEKSGQDITVGDITITSSVSYNYITSDESYSSAIKKLNASGSLVNSGQMIVELGEKLYQGDLKMYEDTTDDFGRPGTRWTYGTTTIGTFSDDPVATYTTKMSRNDLYDVLGKDVVNNYEMELYVDGVLTYDGDITTEYAQTNSSSASCNSGKGVLTEVFVDADKQQVTVSVANSYLMQATGDYSESKGSVAVSVLTRPTAGLSTSVNSLSSDDFDSVANIAEDDYILYTYAQGKVQSAVKAELVSGEVTAYSSAENKNFGEASGSVTLDGTQYDYAKWADVSEENGCATTFSVGNSAALVLDAYGYVLYVDDAALSVGNYVYIDAIAKETNLSTKTIADAYSYDGTNQTITIKELRDENGDKVTISYGSDNRTTSYNGWYSYSRNSSDEYTLTKAETSDIKTDVTSISNNKVTLFGSVTGNSSTIFIVKDEDDNVALYTGITNVPDITIDTANGGYVAYMKDKDDTAKTVASLVFVDVGDNGNVKNSTTSLLYTVKKDSTYVDNSDNEKVERWYVVLDGELTTVETKETWTAGKLYEDYSKDSDGYYETGSAFDTPDDVDKVTETMTISGSSKITQSGDTLTMGSTSVVVGSDTQITLIMIPDNKGDSYGLSGEVMDDNNADYQVESGIAARTLANLFKDRTVDGDAYIVYDDKNDSDLANKIYVVINECSKLGDTSDPTDPETGLPSTSDLPVSVTGSGSAMARYLNGKLYLQFTGLTADAANVTYTGIYVTETGTGKVTYLPTITLDVVEDQTYCNVYTVDFTAQSSSTALTVNVGTPTINSWYMSYGEGITGPATIANNTTDKIELTVSKPEGATEYKYNVTASSFTAESGSTIGSDVENQTSDAKVEVKLTSAGSAPAQVTVARTVTKYALDASMAANAYSADNGVKLAGLTNVTEMDAAGGNLVLDVVLTGTASANNKVVVTYTVNGTVKTAEKDCTAANTVSIDLPTGALDKATTVVVTKVELQSKVTISAAPTSTGNWTAGTATVEVKNGTEAVVSATTYVPVGTSLAVSIKLDSDAAFSSTGVKFVLGAVKSETITAAGEQIVTIGNYQVVVGDNTVTVTVEDA